MSKPKLTVTIPKFNCTDIMDVTPKNQIITEKKTPPPVPRKCTFNGRERNIKCFFKSNKLQQP